MKAGECLFGVLDIDVFSSKARLGIIWGFTSFLNHTHCEMSMICAPLSLRLETVSISVHFIHAPNANATRFERRYNE